MCRDGDAHPWHKVGYALDGDLSLQNEGSEPNNERAQLPLYDAVDVGLHVRREVVGVFLPRAPVCGRTNDRPK